MWSLICIFFDAWLAISANAKAMDRWPTVPLSLARALFCWPFIYRADVRSSSLTKYGWKLSVTESEVENQGLRNDRCAKAQLKMWHTGKQGMLNLLWFKVCPSASVEIRGFWSRWEVLLWELSFLQLEEGNVLISGIRPHLAWSSLLPLETFAVADAISPQLLTSHQSYSIIT